METGTISLKEKEVLTLICAGYSSREIAMELNKSFHTVASQRKKLLKKMDVSNSAELVMKAIENKLLIKSKIKVI